MSWHPSCARLQTHAPQRPAPACRPAAPPRHGRRRRPRDPPARFSGLLFEEATGQDSAADRGNRVFVSDLHLDQIVRAIAGDREERDLLTALLYRGCPELRRIADAHAGKFRSEGLRALFETLQRGWMTSTSRRSAAT